MRNKIINISRLLFVNIVITVFLLLFIEIIFRIFISNNNMKFSPGIYAQTFQPYLMFTNGSTGRQKIPQKWRDIYRNKEIDAVQSRNNYGFRMDKDLDYSKEYVKEPTERLILITGGSAVHGVGATRDETNLASRMERVLNEKQSKYKYKILNFAIGGGVAYQEFLALNLWGKWMDPDWILVMDGHNDIGVCCAHSQGAFFPQYYHHMRSYIDGYLNGQFNPSFYRGWLENQIIKYSHAYRSITRKQYIPCDQYVSYAEGWPRVGIPVYFEDIQKQVLFYLHAQESILEISDRAKYILSLQPVTVTYSDIFGKTSDELDSIGKEKKGILCNGPSPFYEFGLSYFMCRAEEGLKALVKKYEGKRDIQYLNAGACLPDNFEDRKNYLIDNMHLNDLGHDLLGRVMALKVLLRDFPERANDFSKEMDAMLTDVNAVAMFREDGTGIHVIEATYGWSARDSYSPFPKKIFMGNVTKKVKAECDGKTKVEYLIDVRKLGDPANSCAKDFSIKWRCGKEERIYESYVEGEANGKTVVIECPNGQS